jgi:hypothetical protein
MTGQARLRRAAPWLQVIVRPNVEEGRGQVEARCIRCGASKLEIVDAGDRWLRAVTIEFAHEDLCLVPSHLARAATARWN